jgi:hypothetical protein
MAANVAESFEGDRILLLMRRNESLNQAMAGMNQALAQLCDEYSWLPEGLRFQTPHMDGRGLIEFRFAARKRGYPGFIDARLMGDNWLAGSNQTLAEFLGRARSWRVAIEDVYGKSERFGFEHGIKFDDLVFGTPRIRDEGIGWMRVHRSGAEEAVAQRQGTGR